MNEAIENASAPIQYVYFDIAVYPGQNRPPKDLGRLHMALYATMAPQVVKNFRTICSGHFPMKQQHINPFTRRPITHYTYANTLIHRVLPGHLIQGGDITHGTGNGPSPSIFGGLFKPDSFRIKFNRPYLLAMAASGDSNQVGSQWFITTAPAPHLNDKFCAFGEIFDNHSKLILQDIQEMGTQSGAVNGQVVIKQAGIVDPILAQELLKIHMDRGMCDIMVADLYGRVLKDRFGDTEVYDMNMQLTNGLEGYRRDDMHATLKRGAIERWRGD